MALGKRLLVEAVAAGAAARRVGVVDGEALLLDGVFEVDRRAVQVRNAHLVDDHLDPVEVDRCVPVEQALVEVELVDEAGASARLDGDAQAKVVAPLLLVEALDLAGGRAAEEHAVLLRGGRDTGENVSHGSMLPLVETTEEDCLGEDGAVEHTQVE